jgi:hypothetical protein
MEVETLRMAERIIISLGGILSIFLGYRLFYIASLKNDSGAEFKSALFSGSFTKVGPGVFFALFGAYIMLTSITTQIDIQSNQVNETDSRNQAAALSQIATTAALLPDSAEKSRIIGLVRQAQQKSNQKSSDIVSKKSMRID